MLDPEPLEPAADLGEPLPAYGVACLGRRNKWLPRLV
jgi:hypothetical protein